MSWSKILLILEVLKMTCYGLDWKRNVLREMLAILSFVLLFL